MSYIQERYTVEQFLVERSEIQVDIAKSALSQLDRFSKERFQVSGQQLFEDLGKEKNEDKTFFSERDSIKGKIQISFNPRLVQRNSCKFSFRTGL